MPYITEEEFNSQWNDNDPGYLKELERISNYVFLSPTYKSKYD